MPSLLAIISGYRPHFVTVTVVDLVDLIVVKMACAG